MIAIQSQMHKSNSNNSLIRNRIALSVCWIVLLTSNAMAQKSFQWRFVEGAVWNVTLKQDTSVTVNGMENASSQQIGLTWTVKSLNPDKTANVEQEIRSIVVSSAGTVIYDSRQDTNETGSAPNDGAYSDVAKKIRPLLGTKVVAVTTPAGKVSEVLISREVTDALLRMLPMAEQQLREMTKQGTLRFPESQLSVGDTWVDVAEQDLGADGTIKIETTYQYQGEETVGGKLLDKIKATTAFRVSNPERAMTRQDTNGTIWFDNAAGRIDHLEVTQEMAFKFKNANPPIDQKSVIRIRLQFE